MRMLHSMHYECHISNGNYYFLHFVNSSMICEYGPYDWYQVVTGMLV